MAANFSWELIAAVYRVAPVRLWHIGDALWLGLDAGDLSALDDPASVEAIRAVSLTR